MSRYDQAGALASILSNCAATVATTSCVEMAVPDGQWRYTVRAVVGNWSGTESAMSAPVTVGAATLVFTSSTTITSLPATLSGTISNFASNESLSFHLDGTTGPLLSGSPATVPAGGSATISVTIPAGTNDAPHSVFAIGGLGSVAAASINIIDPPHLVSLVMKDTDANGKVDQVQATFDDTLASYSAGTAPWTLTNVPSAGSLQSVTVSGAVATLTIAEGAGAANTAAGSFTVALAANSAGIRDIYDHPASFAATAVVDRAAPAVTTMVMKDTNANGKVDQVAATFSESLAAYSAGTGPWTLANTPSAGSLSAVSVSSSTATLIITEGAGAADTAVNSFTAALATNASGVRDAAGNLSVFSARAPADTAAPIRSSMDMLDVNHDGYVDTVTVTFSEPLAAYTAGNGVWTLTNVPSSGTLASVGVSGAVVTLNLTPGTGAASTALGTFRVALTASGSGVRDVAGNQSSFAAAAPADKAPPAPIALQLRDNNTNGKVDRVTATFSETLAAYSAGTAPWTLIGVPSGGTLSSVSRAGVTATLTITEGAGAADTTTGSMTVALVADPAGIRDAAGNLTSFAAASVTDSAGPVALTITDTNGATDGKIEPGDTLLVTYTEPLNPATVPTSTTVTLADPLGSGNDTLNITGITNGNRSTGNGGYITADGASAAFTSTVALSNGNRTITITIGPTCTGTGCTALGTVAASPTLSWSTATTVTDPTGNAAAGTKTQAIRLF